MDMEKALAHECIAGHEQSGQRLDAALAVLFPSLGLRGRRRLWKSQMVLVDGIARSPAFRLQGGETIRLVPACLDGAEQDVFAVFSEDPPRLLARRGGLFFLYKPSALHTESLAGSSAYSLASALERIMPDASVMQLQLLTRLDQGTSGIVTAAGDEDAAWHWRQQENAGGISKQYLAVLEGQLDSEQTVRNALDLTQARRTRVLDADGPVLRHTRIRPLAYFLAADAPELISGCPGDLCFTLALCCITKGARHQIRAHAAHIGHPLTGDKLYGARSGAPFFLHHCHVQWPEGQVFCIPSWRALLPVAVQEQIRPLEGNVTFCARNGNIPA